MLLTSPSSSSADLTVFRCPAMDFTLSASFDPEGENDLTASYTSLTLDSSSLVSVLGSSCTSAGTDRVIPTPVTM